MAQSQQRIEAILKGTFALQVAVRCTDDAEAVCRKNRLSFSTLLTPFSQLSSQVQLKGIQGHLYTLRNVRVRFSEPQLEPTPDSKFRMTLSNVVQKVTGGRDGKLGPWIQFGDVTTLASTPWYDHYRDTFMETLNQSDHECIRHYVSVLLVVSTNHPNPLEAFSDLYTRQKQSEQQSKYPKWLTPHLYYYHVLLHDVAEGNSTQAHDKFEKVKGTFGPGSCYLLQVNSRVPGTPPENIPDPWNQFVLLRQEQSVGEDGVDFSLKFRKSKKTEGGDETSSNLPNHLPHEEGGEKEGELEVIKPNDAREEAILIDSNSSESLCELNQTSVSLEVEPGSDPLTQLASERRSESPIEPNFSLSPPPLNYQRATSSSSPSLTSTPVGQCLTLENHNALRSFVQDFVGQRLLPHLEAVVKNLNEWLVSRKSVRRSITSMGNKLMKMFGGGPPINSALTEEQSYPDGSLELQTRQLADLAFLLQNYELAFQTYHSVKKDFQGSSAWLHYAGAVEMCGVSAYMLSSTRREVISYLEEAISVYSVTCKVLNFSLRSSFLLSEILKERGQYRDLTQLYIKMTAEDADLRSALCLEQAAHAFLRVQPSFSRKYALHLILAGHRYAKAVQKVHSIRVYRHALEVYHNNGWTLAEDYIHFSLARHSFSLHRLRDAKLAFEHLLAHESAQTPPQQLQNLKEFIFVYRQLLSSGSPLAGDQVPLEKERTSHTSAERIKDVPLLPFPFVRSKHTQVLFATGVNPRSLVEQDTRLRKTKDSPLKEEKLFEIAGSDLITDSVGDNTKNSTKLSIVQRLRLGGGDGGGSLPEEIIGASDYVPAKWARVSERDWEQLEKRAAGGCQGVLRENFSPSVLWRESCGDNSKMTPCVIGEPVGVGFLLKNPLSIPLHMSRISLTWLFTPSLRSNEDNSITSSTSSHSNAEANTEVLEKFVLQPEEERMLTLHITPMKEGELKVLGFIYNICIDSSQQRGSESPSLPAPSSRTNLPSLTVSSRDTLYQKHQGLGMAVQDILTNGVQGRVDVNVRGPRLNNTKLEKSSVVYGADHRLHWVVSSPMPKIVACISGTSKTLLVGEVHPLTVEVYNCGQVALNSLRITSNLNPHLLFMEEKTAALTTEGSIYLSASSSPSSVLPPPPVHPLTPSQCIELPLSHGRLEPGEQVRASLLIQGEGLGIPTGMSMEVPWNLVLYYEPAVITATSRLSHRVLRHSCSLQVRDSLYAKASSVHSLLPATCGDTGLEKTRFDMNQLVITVEFRNKCQIVESSAIELRVVQISSVSKRWRIGRMDREQGEVSMLPGEGGVVLLKASRMEEGGGKEVGLCFTDEPLGQMMIQSSQFPASDLLFGSELCQSLLAPSKANSDVTQADLRLGWGGRGTKKVQQEEIALLVFWQATIPSASGSSSSPQVTYGHHTLTVTMPQSMAETSSSQPPSPYDLVKFHLEHPVSYRHDFASHSLCQIPIHITLQNCYRLKLESVLELLQPRESGSSPDPPKSPKSPHSHSFTHHHTHTTHHTSNHNPHFVWTGGTCQRHLSLEANSTRTVMVYALFSRPGVYSLGHLRVLASREGRDGHYHVQRWQRTSYITIE